MRLIVVGGVAGGLSFAARARRLCETDEIIVFEKGPYPSFSNCGLPFHLGGEIPTKEALLLNTPEALRDKLNLDVRVNTQVVGLDPTKKTVTVEGPTGRETLGYDRLILSPGASGARPDIPGLELSVVHTLRTVDDAVTLAALAQDSTQAVVIGGGFIGLEAAEALRSRGLDVTLVEASPQVMPGLEPEIANLAQGALMNLGIRVLTGTTVREIRPAPTAATAAETTLVEVQLSDGSALPAGLIVLAAGVQPNTQAFVAAGVEADPRGYLRIDQHGRTNIPDVFALGDATTQLGAVTGTWRPTTLAGPTNRAGRLIADFIYDPQRARPLPRPLGTAIVRIGSMTVARTGANRAELQAAGIAHHTIFTHPTDHGTFLPGAQPMQLLLHFDAQDGRILGAQGIGGNGVDKRIDDLAVALRAGMRAPDLIDLDLAYSPPYGSAKDPVNFLGYVAENVLSGRLELWQASEFSRLPAGAVLVDVRPAVEFRGGHLRGAVNVPQTQLRDRIDELSDMATGAPDGVVYLCDESGQTAWLAANILAANEIHARVLTGGVNTVFAAHFANPGEVLEM